MDPPHAERAALTITRRWLRTEPPPRYYLALLRRDLLGHWVVQRHWGALGTHRGGEKTSVHPSPDAARAALERIARARARHGYREQS